MHFVWAEMCVGRAAWWGHVDARTDRVLVVGIGGGRTLRNFAPLPFRGQVASIRFHSRETGICSEAQNSGKV